MCFNFVIHCYEIDCFVLFVQWNSHGYDIAKLFSKKFTYVSPVWLQVKRRQGGTFYMQGDHDIDQGTVIIIV